MSEAKVADKVACAILGHQGFAWRRDPKDSRYIIVTCGRCGSGPPNPEFWPPIKTHNR